nr:sodium-coupled monocarboxylate transporter 1-like [Procambarus clarkii]
MATLSEVKFLKRNWLQGGEADLSESQGAPVNKEVPKKQKTVRHREDIHGLLTASALAGNATETYLFGTQVTTTLLGCIPGTIFVSQVILPIFYNLKIVSLNEYLELRFKSRCLRKMATCCQLLLIAMSMSMGVYVPSLALSAVTNLTTVTSILIMGSISTFYVTIGGVRAVVYTDVLQTLLMFVGVLVVVVVCCVNLGGVATVWHIADHGSRLEFFNLDTSPFVRHSLCSTLVLGFYLMIGVVGCNQPTYQRLASVSTLHTAQWLCIFTLVGLWCLWSLFFFSGLVAYATYRDCDPLTTGKITKPDQIIPFLVTDKLNHLTGMAGIFVSAVYSGVLSTLSTLGNSAACLIWEDFLKHRPYFSRLSSAGAIKAVMIISAGTGVMATSLGLMVGDLGNAFHVIVSINSAISGPLCGIFLTGICAPWVNHKSIVVGFVTSILYSMWTVIGKFLRGGGSPRRLPLSTQGCPGALALNTTVEDLLNTTMLDSYGLLNPTLNDGLLTNATAEHEIEFKTIYDVSYCYLGMIGIILTAVVASLVSCCTERHQIKSMKQETRQVLVTVKGPISEKLDIGIWSMFTYTRLKLPEPVSCFRCQRFGHQKESCKLPGGSMTPARVVGRNAGVVGLNARVVGLNARVVDLNARVAGLKARVGSLNARVVGLNPRLVGLNIKVVGLNARVVTLNARVVDLNARVVDLNARVSPEANPQQFKDQLMKTEHCLENLTNQAPHIILLGNFNLRHLKWKNLSKTIIGERIPGNNPIEQLFANDQLQMSDRFVLNQQIVEPTSKDLRVATPQDLPPGTVNASCERVYRRVTVFLRDGETRSSIHSTCSDEATLNMLPIHHPHHPK